MNESVVVTGCDTGFGQATALHLAEIGFVVHAGMRDLQHRGELDAAASSRGVRVRPLQLDVTDASSVERAIGIVMEQSGRIDGLVNNAGLMIRGYFEDLLDSEIRETVEMNLFGTMQVVRAVLPHMRRASRGRIVIVTSVASRCGSPSGSAYSASRFAQAGFAESLAQEVAPLGVHVTLVEPGITLAHLKSVDRGAGARATDPNRPYYQWFRRADRLLDQAAESSRVETSDVAQVVGRALTSRRPRLRYVVGRRAKLLLALRRHIPGEWFDRFYFRQVVRRVTTDVK